MSDKMNRQERRANIARAKGKGQRVQEDRTPIQQDRDRATAAARRQR